MIRLITLLSTVLMLAACNASLVKKRSLNTTAWGYSYSKDPASINGGGKVERFEVRPGDCGTDSGWSDCDTDRERSEISVKPVLSAYRNHWIGYSIFMPKDFESSPSVRTTLGQIHIKGGFSGSAGGFKSFPPLIQINAYGDGYVTQYHRLSGSKSKIVDESDYRRLIGLSEMKGRWVNVLLNLSSKGPSSVLEIYIDGSLVERFEQSLPNSPAGFYFKYGIYRSFISRHGKPMPTQVVYFKDVKIGSERKDVDPNGEKFTVNPADSSLREKLILREKEVADFYSFKTLDGKQKEACKDPAFVEITGSSCK